FVTSYSSRSRLLHPQPTTHLYTLSLHDALPILNLAGPEIARICFHVFVVAVGVLILSGAVNTSMIGANGVMNRLAEDGVLLDWRSEEHTSELQSHLNLVCRLLLEKKKKTKNYTL